MDVEVRLFATLREGRFKRQHCAMPEGSTLDDLLRSIDVPPDEVGMCLVNGRHGASGLALQTGDVVALFPAVAGG